MGKIEQESWKASTNPLGEWGPVGKLTPWGILQRVPRIMVITQWRVCTSGFQRPWESAQSRFLFPKVGRECGETQPPNHLMFSYSFLFLMPSPESGGWQKLCVLYSSGSPHHGVWQECAISGLLGPAGSCGCRGGRWWSTRERPLRREACLARRDTGGTEVSACSTRVLKKAWRARHLTFPQSWWTEPCSWCEGDRIPCLWRLQGKAHRGAPLSLLPPGLLPFSSWTQAVFCSAWGGKWTSPPYKWPPLPGISSLVPSLWNWPSLRDHLSTLSTFPLRMTYHFNHPCTHLN